MNIIEIAVDALIPYENNPRNNEKAVDAVAASIKEFKFRQPIVIDANNVIVCGHTRLLAAKKLKMKSVPCVMADDLTEEQIRAYRLADNKVAELAGWNDELLGFEMSCIKEVDMSAFGFEMPQDAEQCEAVEDDYDEELPAVPKSKLGDIYQLGDHRLMCGDSTSHEDISKLTGGAKIALALTDPPYGINAVKINGNEQRGTAGGGGKLKFNSKKGTIGGANETHFKTGKVGGGSQNTKCENRIAPAAVVAARSYLPIKGDEGTDTARSYYEETKDITEHQIIFGGNYFTDFLSPSRCWIVWDKNNTGNFADAELAWTDFDKGVKLYKFTWNGLQREGKRDVEGVHRVHPTQKPVGMLTNILNDFSQSGDGVLDCFGGSGSTLIACEKTGRRCFMMEYEAGYVDIIIDRWEKLTGKKAVKLN